MDLQKQVDWKTQFDSIVDLVSYEEDHDSRCFISLLFAHMDLCESIVPSRST